MGAFEPTAPLVEIRESDYEQPTVIADLEGPTRMSDQIRKFGFAVIAMQPDWAAEVGRMDGLARDFFGLQQAEKERFEHPKHISGYCPPCTIHSDMSIPEWPDFNERLITGGNRSIPQEHDQRVIPLESSMRRCLSMAREVLYKLMEQEAAIPGADPFFSRVASGEITCDDEPYQQLNFFGHADSNVTREDGEPLQVPHIDLTVATVLFAKATGGQSAPGLTVQLPDETWALLMAGQDEAIVSFQMKLPSGVPPMRHYVTNPGKEQRQKLQRISGATFLNPDAGQDLVPEMIYQQAFDDAQTMFDQKFE